LRVLQLVADMKRDDSYLGFDGEGFLLGGELTLQRALELVPSIRTESYFEYDSSALGPSGELREIPLDERDYEISETAERLDAGPQPQVTTAQQGGGR
jgi:hypothetical protein